MPLLLERGGLRRASSACSSSTAPRTSRCGASSRAAASRRPRCARSWRRSSPRAERLARADDVIDNSGPPAAIAPQVARLDRRYRALARGDAPDAPARRSNLIRTARLRAECRIDAAIAAQRALRDPLRASAERAHPHADAARGSLRARSSSPRRRSRPIITRRCSALFEITDVAARADLKTDLLQELERQKQLLAPLRSNPAIEQARARAAARRHRPRERGAARADGQGRRAPARQRVADDDQAAHGDSRRRLRVRPARLSLLAATRTRARGRTISRGWIAPFLPIRDGLAIILRLLRDNGRASRQTALSRRLPADADDDEGRAAAAPHRRARPALRARDQREQVRAQHPLHRRVRHGPRHACSTATSSSSSCSAISDCQRRRRSLPVRAAATPVEWTPASRWRPFCSERCKMIDLGAWATRALSRAGRGRRPRPDAPASARAGASDPRDRRSARRAR